jgi:hypothetical protein
MTWQKWHKDLGEKFKHEVFKLLDTADEQKAWSTPRPVAHSSPPNTSARDTEIDLEDKAQFVWTSDIR